MKGLLLQAVAWLGDKLWRRWFPKECDHNWIDLNAPPNAGINRIQECLKCRRRRVL